MPNWGIQQCCVAKVDLLPMLYCAERQSQQDYMNLSPVDRLPPGDSLLNSVEIEADGSYVEG